MDRSGPSHLCPSADRCGATSETMASSTFRGPVATTLVGACCHRSRPRCMVWSGPSADSAEHLPTNRRSTSQRALVDDGDTCLHGGCRNRCRCPTQFGLATRATGSRVGCYSSGSRVTVSCLVRLSRLARVGYRSHRLWLGRDLGNVPPLSKSSRRRATVPNEGIDSPASPSRSA